MMFRNFSHASFAMVSAISILCASDFALVLAPASAGATAPARHVCDPADRPPPRPVGAVDAPDDPAMQAVGCLPRAYELDSLREAGAQEAVRLREDDGSLGAIYVYRTAEERAALIDRYAQRWTALPVSAQIGGFFAGNWKVASVQLPDGSILGAVFEDKANAGSICIYRANIMVLRESRPVLGNWCMDRLRLW